MCFQRVSDLEITGRIPERNGYRTFKPAHPWNDLADAGLLMFGDEYRIAREFPAYFPDYREMPVHKTMREAHIFASSWQVLEESTLLCGFRFIPLLR